MARVQVQSPEVVKAVFCTEGLGGIVEGKGCLAIWRKDRGERDVPAGDISILSTVEEGYED